MALRWLMAVMLLATSHVAMAAYCTSPQSATVNSGGSVTFDVSNCDGPDNFGMSDGAQPSHGSYVLTGQLDGAGTERVTYTNNGDGATSDSFYLLDQDNGQVVFNITINPSRTASIAVSPSAANEDSGTSFVYTVTLSQTNTSATTVNLTRSGTATSGTDYSGAATSVVVPANTSSASFAVTPIADTTVEADETVTFSVASGTGYSTGSPASATATIVNDDFPVASIAVSPASVTEDGATNLLYTVTLDQPSPSALSIGFGVSGTATSGTDYAAVSSPLVIAAGQTTGTITINPTADTTVEPDETVVISLNTGSGYTVGSPNSATGTILNDDLPVLSINDVSVNEGNAGTTNATFTVSLSAPAGAGGVSFDIATADGTATAGVDYVVSSLTGQTIPAGSSSATFTVLVNGDTLAEPNETFFVNVSNVTGATVSDGQGLGTIVNDDAQPALSIDDVSVNEGNSGTTTATFTVSLSAASGQTVTVNYATADGTATAGSDYVARSGTLTFAPGVTAQGVAVTVNGDTAVEPNETFSVGLSGASNATIARATGTGTILNDDAVVTISPASLPAATAGSAYSQTLTASGGTPGYTFVVSAGALPAGLTLSASGVLSGTPTASGSFNFTATATDSGTPTSGSRAYTLTVAGATVILPATTLPAGTAGQAYSSAITPATGGIAPYSYALTAGALPAGITLNSSSGALSGTTTSVGSFSFTVTATDSTSGTPSQGTRGYTLNIAAPTIAVAPSTVPTATRGTAYSQTLTASGGTAAYTYAITSGALPAGITLASNGTLSGTATVEGTFNFTVQATDANSFTGTQAYSLTVAGPNLVLPASALPAGTAGQAYAAAITPATGGTAPYSYAVTAGALPGGVVLDAATGGLSGTPTAAGTFTFTLTVTDSTPSPAAQASRSYSLTINAATLVLAQPTLPAAVRGTAYNQVLTASGGIAPYRYSIASGALPAGLTLASDGTLSGTPTVQGTSSFTIAVADAGNASATQAYTFTVNDAAPVAVADVAATMTDTAVTAAVTANDTGSITAIAIASAPTNGTAVVNGLEVVYTPNAGFAGTDVLSYTASGAGGTSAAVTLTITVNVRPVAVSVTAAAVPGEAQQVDITRNATGGPFVAAAVVAVLPASAGTATITRVGGTASAAAARASGLSPAATAMAETPTFTLTFTPNPAFVGQATVQFTLSNAFATSAPATVVFNIAPRRDPSVDAEVRGLIDAQSESTRRFARAQIDNFQRRLEATHRGGSSFTNAVSFQPTSHCRQADRGISAQPCSPDTQDADNDFRDAPAATGSTGSSAQTQGNLGLWVGGAIRSGSLNRQTNSNGVDFQTDGLSVGADYRVAPSLAIGAGLGWGRDDSDVGSNGSHSKATAYTMALYASFHPGKAFFFDTLVGYQLLSYDLRRFVTDDSSLAEGNRDGKQWIASLSTGADLQRGTLQITPYARVDVARATLDGYVEEGVAPFALRYADMDVATTTGNLGLRLEWRREVAWGRLTPQLRVEYQRDFQGRGDAILSYADLTGGPFYRTAQSAFDRNRLMVGIGAALLTEQGLSTRLEYRGITDGDSNNDQTWMINLEKKY
ncbi:autotransporter domain-containing protein [Xanthomonas campestris pv. trichodesmae]|uniref:putative Ig domain-containing protein n=1 Tax=Xanthomonas citri TaxID=346 RepID=UPI001ABF3BD7|nr:putative Ig domain-containing protein [Xanthomonas citri]MBV6782890.1 autotransporter domain-containing protein [Xanthomonas campestris pv. trichodesmae]